MADSADSGGGSARDAVRARVELREAAAADEGIAVELHVRPTSERTVAVTARVDGRAVQLRVVLELAGAAAGAMGSSGVARREGATPTELEATALEADAHAVTVALYASAAEEAAAADAAEAAAETAAQELAEAAAQEQLALDRQARIDTAHRLVAGSVAGSVTAGMAVGVTVDVTAEGVVNTSTQAEVTNRLTNRHTNRLTNRHSNRHTNRLTNRHSNRLTNRHSNRHTNRHSNRLTNRLTNRHAGRSASTPPCSRSSRPSPRRRAPSPSSTTRRRPFCACLAASSSFTWCAPQCCAPRVPCVPQEACWHGAYP